MIFVPNENVSKNTDENGSDFLFWEYNKDFEIMFEWERTPKYNKKTKETLYIKDYNPFYLSVIKINDEEVMKCQMSACQAHPQLRYNKIIDKWYCNCPSSAIKTDNDDKSELLTILSRYDYKYKERDGFCDNPVKAIIMWNMGIIGNIERINMKMMNKLLGIEQ